jgi:hypothetical protein
MPGERTPAGAVKPGPADERRDRSALPTDRQIERGPPHRADRAKGRAVSALSSRDADDGNRSNGSRMVKLTSLWERTSVKGNRYLSGFLGDAQALVFCKGEQDHPTRPGEKVTIWDLCLSKRDPIRRPGGGGR